MSPKSVAFLVVGMLVISSVFFIFHVSYPANPATIKIIPPNTPKNIKPPNLQIFNNQTFNIPGLGMNQTNFSPTGNTTLTLSGYVYNASNHNQVLANQRMGIAVMQAFTFVTTNSQGFYQVQIKASGQGTFAFKIFQFATGLYDLYIGPGMKSLSQNIYLSPMQKYSVSGLTESHGNDIPDVGLTFQSFWGTYASYSTSSGAYSVNMVNDKYVIADHKTGFSPVPTPIKVNVNSTPQTSFNINLNTTNQAILHMSGFVFNLLGNPVPGASLAVISPYLQNGTATTFANGYYNLSVAYYSNTIQIDGLGYTSLTNTITITHNLTNQNFTLTSFNPFQQNVGKTGIQSPGPNGMNNNSAAVNYASNFLTSISGKVYNNQTGMWVPNQPFTVYTSVNGTYFYYDMQSDASAQYGIYMNYTGVYNFTILSQKFNTIWLDQNLQYSVNNVILYVTTPSSNIYYVNGSLFNKITNGSLTNATIKITGPQGQVYKTIQVNSTGNYNFSLIGGNYQMNISSPGFNSTSQPLNVNKSYNNLNFSLTPTTGISPGSSQWSPSSGTGLPGVNSTNILSQFNSTQQNNSNQSPTTTSATPVTLDLQFNNATSGKGITSTAYAIFIKVNGLYLRVNGTTNSTGGSVLDLAYGGTYILVPEMIDYTGSGVFVNTSQISGPVAFNMNPLPLYNLQINLSNPLSYSGSSVPLSGFSGTGNYFLPIVNTSSQVASNYSLVYYSLPTGNYSFSYNNPAYVPDTFNISINGQSLVHKEVLKPYVLILDWSSSTNWGYYVNSTSMRLSNLNMGTGSGQQTVVPLTYGSYSIQTMLGNVQSNSTSFTLNYTSSEKSLTYNNQQFSLNLSNYFMTSDIYSRNATTDNYSVIYNYSIPGFNEKMYISGFVLNLTKYYQVFVAIDQVQAKGTATSGNYTLSNYFVPSTSTATAITITANGITSQEVFSIMNNAGMIYYNVSLG